MVPSCDADPGISDGPVLAKRCLHKKFVVVPFSPDSSHTVHSTVRHPRLND